MTRIWPIFQVYVIEKVMNLFLGFLILLFLYYRGISPIITPCKSNSRSLQTASVCFILKTILKLPVVHVAVGKLVLFVNVLRSSVISFNVSFNSTDCFSSGPGQNVPGLHYFIFPHIYLLFIKVMYNIQNNPCTPNESTIKFVWMEFSFCSISFEFWTSSVASARIVRSLRHFWKSDVR